jgi:hypothetical protein
MSYTPHRKLEFYVELFCVCFSFYLSFSLHKWLGGGGGGVISVYVKYYGGQ